MKRVIYGINKIRVYKKGAWGCQDRQLMIIPELWCTPVDCHHLTDNRWTVSIRNPSFQTDSFLCAIPGSTQKMWVIPAQERDIIPLKILKLVSQSQNPSLRTWWSSFTPWFYFLRTMFLGSYPKRRSFLYRPLADRAYHNFLDSS